MLDRAAIEHENWIAYLTGVAGCSVSVEVQRVGGVVALRSNVPFDWLNQVLIEGDDARASDLLGTARRRSRDVARPIVRLREGLDDRFVPVLERAGWLAAGAETITPGMTAFPIGHLASMADLPGFQIRRATDAAGLEDHRAVVAEGFGVVRSVADESTGVGLLQRPTCTIYVGYVDGLPVTSGLGWRSGRTIGVYAISTVPAARRRGYGEAMTARVVADGIAAGCDIAALQASAVARPIYERLGFRVDVRYHAYVKSSTG
jgi:GNAT superfamily N-acetyltransferase